MRNKPFPLFDELGRIFGKDRAIGNESANTMDTPEEPEEEERDTEQVPNVQTEDSHAPNTEKRQTETPLSSTASCARTKKARTETIEALKSFSRKLEKMSGVVETASEHIGRLANCFQHESDSAKRRMQLTSEVLKIRGLNPPQVLLSSEKIALNPLQVDFFFSLPDDYKYTYVQGLVILDKNLLMNKGKPTALDEKWIHVVFEPPELKVGGLEFTCGGGW